jgi:2',3'-cyclic-nucleotide 2'-phosphodiesterase (5'-nucleotidase family)
LRGNWLPIDQSGTPCDVSSGDADPSECTGGMWWTAYQLEQHRNALDGANIAHVTIDAGNAIQGNSFHFNGRLVVSHISGSVFSNSNPTLISPFYNMLAYNGLGLGPRDFDYTNRVNASIYDISRANNFSTVLSNVDLSDTTYWGDTSERYIYTDTATGIHYFFPS